MGGVFGTWAGTGDSGLCAAQRHTTKSTDFQPRVSKKTHTHRDNQGIRGSQQERTKRFASVVALVSSRCQHPEKSNLES